MRDNTTADAYRLADGLMFGRIYWTMGDAPSGAGRRNEVKSPPCAGWSHAFVIDRGGKLVTLFCPFTLESFQVTRNSSEKLSLCMDTDVNATVVPWNDTRAASFVDIIRKNWSMVERLSLSGRDLDTAAVILNILGATAPVRAACDDRTCLEQLAIGCARIGWV